MNIIEKIKSLNFPYGEYVVVGSGILDVLNIRDAIDIDIAITAKLHTILKSTGDWEEELRYGNIHLKKDIFEIIPKLNWDKYNTTVEEAILSAKIIEDIPFMNLEELCKFKKALGREKDFKDIELIKNYLDKNNTLRIFHKKPSPTKEAYNLKDALERLGIRVYLELDDGHKHIDLAIPRAKLNVEVDGIQHLTNPHQIVADLNRGYYSHKNGFNTMHISNEMIHSHLKEISDALAEASKIRERKIYVHLN